MVTGIFVAVVTTWLQSCSKKPATDDAVSRFVHECGARVIPSCNKSPALYKVSMRTYEQGPGNLVNCGLSRGLSLVIGGGWFSNRRSKLLHDYVSARL